MEDINLHARNQCLLDELSCANEKTKCMLDEIHELKCKTSDLMQTVLKFTNGKKNLDMLLASQRISFFKTRLGYDVLSKPPLKRNNSVFVKSLHDHTYTPLQNHICSMIMITM